MLAQKILRSIFFALGRSPPKMEIRESRNEGSSRLALIGAEPGNIVVGTEQQDGSWRRSVRFCSNTVAGRCCFGFQQSLTPQPVTSALRTRSWWVSGTVVRRIVHGSAVSQRESSAPRETSDEDLLKSCFERVAAAQAERCDVRPLRAKLDSVEAVMAKAQNQTRAHEAEQNTRGLYSGCRSRTADHEASRSSSRFSPPNCTRKQSATRYRGVVHLERTRLRPSGGCASASPSLLAFFVSPPSRTSPERMDFEVPEAEVEDAKRRFGHGVSCMKASVARGLQMQTRRICGVDCFVSTPDVFN